MLEARKSSGRDSIKCQRKRFDKEICALRTGKPVIKCSPIYKLNPVLEDGLLINKKTHEVKLIDFGCGDPLKKSAYNIFTGMYFP